MSVVFQKGQKVYHESYKRKERIIEKRICKKGFSWVRLMGGLCWVLESQCAKEKRNEL